MFEFLKNTKNHFIGIDFGTSSIKVVDLSYKNQQAHLENYGVVDLNSANQDDLRTTKSSYEQKLNTALKELLKRMHIESGSAYVSIPGFSGLITIIELPDMQEEELSKAIQFEAHKYIPSSLDEVAMSWEVIERSANFLDPKDQNQSNRKIKVLLVAAPKRDIERYDTLVQGSNLEVKAIELETFSIARALVGEEVGTFFIIDIGSRSTNIILVEKGVIRVNRNIDAGGNEITTALSESMNISRQRAEQFKMGERDFLNNTETAIIIPVLELIVGESLRILNAYREKNKDVNISQVILSGGTAKMKGVEQYFTRSLGMQVKNGNPWRTIAFENGTEQLAANLGSSFSVALGLALRGLDEYKRK